MACGPRPRRGHEHPPGLGGGRVAPPPRAAATNTPPPPPCRHRPRGALTPRRPPPGFGKEAGPGGGVVVSPPGSARADARLVYRPQAQAWPPPPPRRPAPSARPPSAQASRLPGAAAGGQVPGRPRQRRRRRPGRGLEGGHRGGRRPGQAGEGAEEGRSRAASGPPALGALATQIIRALEREAESGSRRRRRKSQRFIAFAPHLPGAPPPPLPNHPFWRCSRPSTRSCGPGRRRDHCSLAPARAPVPSAAATAASSASPRRRAHDGAVRPLPDSSVSPAPAAQRPLQLRRGGAAGETRMSLGRNCGEGRQAGEGRPQMTSLPYPASLAAAPSRPGPQAKAEWSIRMPDQNRHWGRYAPGVGGWTECVSVRRPGRRELLQARQSVQPGLGSSPLGQTPFSEHRGPTSFRRSRGLVAASLLWFKRTVGYRLRPDPLPLGSKPPSPVTLGAPRRCFCYNTPRVPKGSNTLQPPIHTRMQPIHGAHALSFWQVFHL
ncbi:gametogenetin-like [Lynx rufus]|uniref:gametogenetin-like n=1 Tax=Lynx rufus TaxID=61384 RepID=UPI001F123848|nr:gametogenetin-like [Lynx rufus]